MDMTKDIMDFELKLECDQFEANDYTMSNAELQKQPESQTDLAYDEMQPNEKPAVEPQTEAEKPAAEAAALPAEPLCEQLQAEQEEQELKSSSSITAADTAEKPKVTEQPLTPPPRPLTSSEVVGHTEPDEPELRVRLQAKKSRSLPTSPQPLVSHNLSAVGLFEFGKKPSVMPTAVELEQKPKLEAKLEAKLGSRKLGSLPAGGNAQQFCLRWNNYQSNLTNVFDELLQNESFVDVTLACEGHSIKAHKMVLSACSPYFQALFYDNPCQHPIIIMRDVNWSDLKALVEFMYKGEINVCQDQINPLLKVAETLKIRGLAEVSAGAGSGSGAGAGLAGASLLPEQRMTVYDEDDDEEELAAAAALLRHEDEDEDSAALLKPKRARLLAKLQAESALDLNQRQRKRSRDGSYATPSPLPLPLRVESPPARSLATPTQPLAMTTSTIVRNPFASPNPQSLQAHLSGSSSSASSSSSGNNSATNGGSSASSGAISSASSGYRASPPPSGRAHSNGSAAALSSPTGHNANAIGSSVPQSPLPPHMAAAVAAAAQGHHAPAPPASSSSMHHHAAAAAAQQLAAQHQLAQSHAAMASALALQGGGAAGRQAASAGGAVGNAASAVGSHHDDMEIKPEIAEMIREEERAKMIESGGHGWMGPAATGTSVADSYQYQLQSMWQKCWNTNQQNLVQQLRFRERGPLKSWRPEAMAEAIFSVLKEGLSLSQAARKYDIPYPTFVLYANRVHNMLGPSLDGGTDPRPKARGRPQRILLGMWPEELIRSVIKAVVFRDYREIKEDMGAHQYANGQAHGAHFGSGNSSAAANGYHNAAAKMAAQNAVLAPPAGSPLSSMTETLRRQILSQQQQQQSPHAQSMNMYKSPAYLQRSEIEDQVSAAAAKHQQSERRGGAENLPDLSALGLMGLPGLMPQSQQSAHQRGADGNAGGAGAAMHPSAASYARELSREREREREMSRDRELKEAMQARQYGNQSRGSNSSSAGSKSAMSHGGGASSSRPSAVSPYSSHYGKHPSAKEHPNYAYNKRFLESLPAGIDFEAIANGLLQKSVNKSPRFEDFFPGQDMSELFASSDASAGAAAAAAAAAAAYAPAGVRESPLMKIKLEQQQATELPHED
ncbi:protein bric-a-brac 2 isoform X2 [Drosophila busckii]|uniref:protein bric-a-brac 2 isoform X2 n=1 Tax=Drosophila busckii TaxID=30019 RepID=UPI001432E469|nr:protein bric-a-brac 2 isoform X2 [Drosophila busckii]